MRRLLLTGLLAGTACAVVLSLAQHAAVLPLVREAERYEGEQSQAGAQHDHAPSTFRRTALTWSANLMSSLGFAFLLAGAMVLRGGKLTAVRGAWWGVAGYAVFVAAPALGLPPEPPGVLAPPVEARHLWWAATVAATAGGLGLLAWAPGFTWRAAGVALLAAPHWVGAPVLPTETAPLLPAGFEARYAAAVLATNAVYWLALGGLTGWLLRRLGGEPDPRPAAATAR